MIETEKIRNNIVKRLRMRSENMIELGDSIVENKDKERAD
jgi:hypothetical protein